MRINDRFRDLKYLNDNVIYFLNIHDFGQLKINNYIITSYLESL